MQIIKDASGNVIGTISETGRGWGPELLLGLFIVAMWGLNKFAPFFATLPEPIRWILTILFVILLVFKLYQGFEEGNIFLVAVSGGILLYIISIFYIIFTSCPFCFHL